MSRVYRPEVVRDDIEYAEDEDEECRGPLGLEADSDHDARCESDDGDEHPSDAPLSLDNEAQEKEDEQDATGEKETKNVDRSQWLHED